MKGKQEELENRLEGVKRRVKEDLKGELSRREKDWVREISRVGNTVFEDEKKKRKEEEKEEGEVDDDDEDEEEPKAECLLRFDEVCFYAACPGYGY